MPDIALLADIFGTLALEDVPDCLSQDAYVAAELNLSLGILRQQRMTLATLDTALANGLSDVVEQLAQIVHVLQGPLPRKPQAKSRSKPIDVQEMNWKIRTGLPEQTGSVGLSGSTAPHAAPAPRRRIHILGYCRT